MMINEKNESVVVMVIGLLIFVMVAVYIFSQDASLSGPF